MASNSILNAEKIHISFFGCRNAGKSSLVNAFTGQSLSVVSDIKGTTTDPVKKAMELNPAGPVLIIDTPGYDDEGTLGNKRINKTYEIIAKTDFAILVIDSINGISQKDSEFLEILRNKSIPYLLVYNKADLLNSIPNDEENIIYASSLKRYNIEKLKTVVASRIQEMIKLKSQKKIIADKLQKDDIVIMVIPIDESAPKGRLILPQQQTIREVLDTNSILLCIQDTELEDTLKVINKKPKLVITDSQVFEKVSSILPTDIMLTSFSILFAKYKGDLTALVKGAKKIDELQNGDKILISEGCTHHRQCNDIGTVKIPSWLENYTGKKFEYTFTSGGEFPQNLTDYALIIHCGGCMLNEQEMKSRIKNADLQNIAIINYGIAIAYMNGILNRSLEIFPEIQDILRSS